jgi:NADPH-dependent 2,4-dienoyl-CoA reductase/sulfur reductase-like enzyme
LKIGIDRFDARLARSVVVPAIDTRIVILGAGFGGLELATSLSEELGDSVEVTLIDKNDAFVFGYSKLDVMFGRTTPAAVRLAYRDIEKPGVRFLRETITAIDPQARRVTTDAGVHEADVLVVALGADARDSLSRRLCNRRRCRDRSAESGGVRGGSGSGRRGFADRRSEGRRATERL